MKNILGLLIIVTAAMWGVNSSAQEEQKTITLAADIWCPYNCDSKDERPGFMVELAKEIFQKKGINVQYVIVPWERAVEDARKGTYSGIIGARVGDAPDFIFPDEPLGFSSNYFYVRSDSTWQFDGIESLEAISLGVIEGYSYDDKLDAYVKLYHEDVNHIQPVSGETALQQNFEKLELKRVDAIVEDINVANNFLKQTGQKDKFKTVGEEPDVNLSNKYVYIAFNPVNKDSKELARILSDGMRELRKSGRLEEILSEYDVEDWK